MSTGRSRRPGLVAALSTTGLVLIATGGIALVVITGNDVVTGGSVNAAPTAPGEIVRKDVPTITQPRPATSTRDPGAGRTTATGGRPSGTVPAASGRTGPLAPAGGAGGAGTPGTAGSQASAPFSQTGGLAALGGVTGAAQTGSTAITALAAGAATGTAATGTVATGLIPARSGSPTAPQFTFAGASFNPLLGPPIPLLSNSQPPRAGGGIVRASAGTALTRLMVALGGSGLTTPQQTSALRFLLLDAQLPALGSLSKVPDPLAAAGGGALDAHESKALGQALRHVCARAACDPLESPLPLPAPQSQLQGAPLDASSQRADAGEGTPSASFARTPAPTGPRAPTAAAPTKASRANPPVSGGADVRSQPAGRGAKAGKEASDSKRGHDAGDNSRSKGKNKSWRQLPQEDRNNDD